MSIFWNPPGLFSTTRTEGPAALNLRVARHEAGHALAVILRGGRVNRLELGPNHGSTFHNSMNDIDTIFVCLAGSAVEVLNGAELDAGSKNDLAEANRRMASSGISPDELDDLIADAKDEMSRHQAAIDGLAAELIRQGALDGNEVHRIAALYRVG